MAISTNKEELAKKYKGIYSKIKDRLGEKSNMDSTKKMIKAIGECDFYEDFAVLNKMAFNFSSYKAETELWENAVFGFFSQHLVSKGIKKGEINKRFRNLLKKGFNEIKKKFKILYKDRYKYPGKWKSECIGLKLDTPKFTFKVIRKKW